MTIERGQLLISPIRRTPSDDVEALKARLYAMLPRVRITDLSVEVAAWSGFADQFVHARSREPASDQSALMGAVLADATNLGAGPDGGKLARVDAVPPALDGGMASPR